MIRRKTRSSRLLRTSERQSKKQAFIFTVGIIFVIVFLVQFGPAVINFFGNIVYTLRGVDQKTESEQFEGDQLIQPPILLDIPQATQSAELAFSGIAPYAKGVVEIYVNDRLKDEINLSSKEFKIDGLKLVKGENRIKARFVDGKSKSHFSDNFIVIHTTEEPKLEITNPSDGATFTKADKNIIVSGITDLDSIVMVNSFRAIVDENGEFTYHLALADGENQIEVVAQNKAGLKKQKNIKVTYIP